MSWEERLVEKLKNLPQIRKAELLDFVEFLEQKEKVRKPLKSLEGIWGDLDINISDKDIDHARRELWSNFPRDVTA